MFPGFGNMPGGFEAALGAAGQQAGGLSIPLPDSAETVHISSLALLKVSRQSKFSIILEFIAVLLCVCVCVCFSFPSYLLLLCVCVCVLPVFPLGATVSIHSA